VSIGDLTISGTNEKRLDFCLKIAIIGDVPADGNGAVG
jgi:hypothetical protein